MGVQWKKIFHDLPEPVNGNILEITASDISFGPSRNEIVERYRSVSVVFGILGALGVITGALSPLLAPEECSWFDGGLIILVFGGAGMLMWFKGQKWIKRPPPLPGITLDFRLQEIRVRGELFCRFKEADLIIYTMGYGDEGTIAYAGNLTQYADQSYWHLGVQRSGVCESTNPTRYGFLDKGTLYQMVDIGKRLLAIAPFQKLFITPRNVVDKDRKRGIDRS